MTPLDLDLLNLTIPFTEQELNVKYKEALKIGIRLSDKKRIKAVSHAFLQINKNLRTNPFLNKKNKNRLNKDTYTITVTDTCKKCLPIKIGNIKVPSGKAEVVCPRCKGHKKILGKNKHIVTCKRCKGKGKIKVICKYCKGAGYVFLSRKIFNIT